MIWDTTISHCLKQWIWHRTGLCGGCGRCTVLHNLELNARNDDDPNCSLERLHTHQTLCHTVLAYVTYHFNGGGKSEHSSMLNVTPLWGFSSPDRCLQFALVLLSYMWYNRASKLLYVVYWCAIHFYQFLVTSVSFSISVAIFQLDLDDRGCE